MLFYYFNDKVIKIDMKYASKTFIDLKTRDDMENKKFFIDGASGIIEGSVYGIYVPYEVSIKSDPPDGIFRGSYWEHESRKYDAGILMCMSSFDVMFTKSLSRNDIPILIDMFTKDSGMMGLKIQYDVKSSIILRLNTDEIVVSKTLIFNTSPIDELLKTMLEYSKICDPIKYIISYHGDAWYRKNSHSIIH